MGLNWSEEELERVLQENDLHIISDTSKQASTNSPVPPSLKGLKTEIKMPGTRNTEEEDLQRLVIAWLKSQGWLTHAERKSINRKGVWSTPIQGDAGFPDIVAVHPGPDSWTARILFAELKSRVGKYSSEQVAWITAIGQAGIEIYCIDVDDFQSFKDKTKYEAVK